MANLVPGKGLFVGNRLDVWWRGQRDDVLNADVYCIMINDGAPMPCRTRHASSLSSDGHTVLYRLSLQVKHTTGLPQRGEEPFHGVAGATDAQPYST